MKGKKQSIWFKELDLVFVYLVIFVVGIIIVLSMTSYLNNKVKEFTEVVPASVSE